jgi:hypothetical protein
MSLRSDFPNGFPGGITIRGVPVTLAQPGKVFWVSNATTLLEGQRGGSDGNKGTFNSPFSTLAGAIAQCVANRGDIVLIKPGHTETISSSSALTLSIAGVAIIGLGLGSSKPTFTLDTATDTTINVTAANVTFKNIIVTANFADIVSAFTTTTAKYFALEDCYFKATATNMNFLSIVDTNTTTADTDGLSIVRCKWIEPDLATLYMVKMDGTNADIQILDNYVHVGVNNNKATLLNVANGKTVANLFMGRNRVFRLNTDTATGAILFHTNGSTNTGLVFENVVQHADTAAELLITASDSLGCVNNYASGVAGASGYLLPAADS